MDALAKLRKQLRVAFGNYMFSEGCGCCRGANHDENAEVIAKLLNVPKYDDGSGYDFLKYSDQFNKEN